MGKLDSTCTQPHLEHPSRGEMRRLFLRLGRHHHADHLAPSLVNAELIRDCFRRHHLALGGGAVQVEHELALLAAHVVAVQEEVTEAKTLKPRKSLDKFKG